MIVVPDHVIDRVDKLIYDFISKGIGKLKKKVLASPLNSGGCNMPIFRLKVTSLKFMWVPRLVDSNSACWKNYPVYLFEPSSRHSPLRGVLSNKIIQEVLEPKLPSFYQGVLKSWNSIKPPKENGNFICSILWNCKYSFFVTCRRSLEYVNIEGKTIFLKDLKTKYVYKLLLTDFMQPASMLAWQNELQQNINWSNIWKLAHKVTNENKLRAFHWKFLHRTCINNVKLYRWNKRQNALCEYCNVIDTTKHRYFDCKIASKIWKVAEHVVKDLYQQNILFTWEIIVQGLYVSGNTSNKVNLILLIAKWSIHKCRCLCICDSNTEMLFKHELKIRNILI